MKKTIFLLLAFLSLSSCDIPYNGDVKLVTKGRVLNADGSPVTDKEIKLFVHNRGGSIPFLLYISSETNFIGKTKTDANGNYAMVIPEPNPGNYSEIIIEVNDDENELSSKRFRNISETNYVNYEFTAPDAVLYEKTSLTKLYLNYSNTTPHYELMSVEYFGHVASPEYFINLPEENPLYYTSETFVLKNSEVTIRYTVKDWSTNQLVTNEVVVYIDDSNFVEYTLEY